VEPWGTLRVEVFDTEIVVSLPGSIYCVTYYRPERSPQLLGKNFPKRDECKCAEGGSGVVAIARSCATRRLGVCSGRIPLRD
jgi:hypothetical protein